MVSYRVVNFKTENYSFPLIPSGNYLGLQLFLTIPDPGEILRRFRLITVTSLLSWQDLINLSKMYKITNHHRNLKNLQT